MPRSWVDIAFSVSPNSSITFSILLDNAEPGRYKIVKDVERGIVVSNVFWRLNLRLLQG